MPLVRRVLACLVLASSLALGGALPAAAVSPDLFFSEYVEGTSNNKALEIFNGTGAPVNLAAGAYGVQMYFNGSTSAGTTINLSGTIAPGDVFLLVHNSAEPALRDQADQLSSAPWYNGDDAVVLRKGLAAVDVLGQIGLDPGTEWGAGLVSTADNTLRRKRSIVAGDTDAFDAFDPALQWDGFATNTYDGLGSHATGGDAPVTVTCGGALSALEGAAVTRNVSATDADGTVTDLAVSVAPTPTAGSITRTAFAPATAAGRTASATVTASDAVPAGSYTVTVTGTNDDVPTAQTGSCSFTLTVTDIKAIGEVQGTVADADNGALHRSPLAPPSGNSAGATVFVQGVVYQKTLARTNAGAAQHGFFIQNTAATADANPLTSDGIFVFMGGFTTLIGGYAPNVGDEVVVSGRVSEFFNMTQLSSARMERFVSSANAVAPFEAVPPDDLADANRYWERREGMLGRLQAGSLVLDGRDVFPSTADSEVWTAPPGASIATRTDPYARRSFRDAHPLDDFGSQLFDNGNGYRVLAGPMGVKAAAANRDALLAPSRTFQTVSNAPAGGVNFSFNKYRLEITEQLALAETGIDPSLNAPPQAFDRGRAYSVSDYNVENLYDRRDDPHDGCDFTGNAGCPGVNPPFDYVPASEAVYRAHLEELAAQIRNDLHAPDVLLVQEAEDQDICTVAGSALTCGTADNADGKADTLQELALEISAQGGPAYEVAYDRDGADDRGIVSAFMYRTDRVERLPVDASDPVFGRSPTVAYRAPGLAYNADVENPKALNATLPADVDLTTGQDGTNVFTRPPQMGLFRVWRTGVGESVFTDLLLSSNHFSSTPDRRVGQRTEQSRYLAAIYAAANSERALAGGDFNTFPRPDDPLAPAGSSDQLGPLYDAAGMTNLFDRLVAEVPASAYSYVFVGQAQTLDGQFVSPALAAELDQARIAHVNADWPADHIGDGARGASDHDPMVSRLALDVTLAGVRQLFDYYVASGEITGKNTAAALRHHLQQAAAKPDAYADQLEAFVNHVRGKTPRFVTPEASEALVAEAERLLAQP